jgi:hypothetical protein
LIDFAYTGEATNLGLELMVASDKFGLPELFSMCQHW